MARYATAYGIALVLFLVIDAIWLGLIARTFYVSRMGSLMADRPNFVAAAIFYALFVVGIVYFAISGAMASGGWSQAALNGALFGFFSYLTYNFTNLSVVKGFDPVLAVADTVWGTVLGGLVAGLTLVILSALGRS